MPRSLSSLLGTLVAVIVSLGAPAGFITAIGDWPQVADQPVLTGALWLLASGVLYVGGRFTRALGRELIDRPAEQLARSMRVAAVATLHPGRQRRYLRQLRLEAQEMDQRGVETRDVFGPLLDDIYIEVSLDRGWAAAQGAKLVKRWKGGERASLNHFLTHRLPDSAGAHRVFTVTGQPGSGKTALLRHTALERCTKPDQLPVLLYLREHADVITADDPPSIVEVAAASPVMQGIPTQWLRWRLERGRCLVLLDGLDEVADSATRHAIAAWIQEQTRRFHNQYVITSRPGGFTDTALDSEVPLHMRAFTVAQTGAFVRRWYEAVERRKAGESSEATRARAVRKAADLRDQFGRRPALYDLASRPLLLSMIANVHYFRNKLPGGRADLYREVCDMLLKRQISDSGSSHGVGRLRHTQRAMLIRNLALAMMERNVRVMPAAEAKAVISANMARIPEPVPPGAFLSEMVYNGLLIAGRKGHYEFPHATLQEFLASSALRDEAGARFLAERVTDPRWHEVIILWAAVNDASPVVRACLDSDSDTAVWLAFACAKHPHELDPELQDELARMRADGNVPLLVKINDNLHEIMQLGEDVIVCARPVDAALYAEYLLDLATKRVPPSPDTTLRLPSSGLPARGMWATDARRLVEWVNEHTDDETAYRLPTVAELDDPSIGKVVDIDRYPVWADGEHGDALPRLYCRGPVCGTYSIDDDRLMGYLRSDRKHTGAYLIIALAFLRAASMSGDFIAVFDGSLRFDEVFGFARRIDDGADPDPAVAAVARRVLAWYRAFHRDAPLRLNRDLDALLHRIPDTDTVRQLRRLGVLPDAFGPREYLTITSYVLLLVPWLRNADISVGAESLADLDAFVGEQVRGAGTAAVHRYPEHIMPCLETAERAMRAHRIVDPMARDLPPGLASGLVVQAREVVNSLLSGEGYDRADMTCARLAAAAACVLVRQLSGLDEAAEALHCALGGLAVLGARIEGDIEPTELLLLARA